MSRVGRAFDLARAMFAERLDRGPLADVSAVMRFAQTRASYVAQTALFGYLKKRMGTSFREHFEDPDFSRVIADSAVRVFASCLADLTVFAVATVARDGALGPAGAAALACHCHDRALEAALPEADRRRLLADAQARFAARAAGVNWPAAARSESPFAGSAADLVRFAPVSDEFRALDREIVTNSIRFRWRDVREQFRRRADAAAIARDWARLAQSGQG
jgi:hypothetical protein